MDTHLSQQEKRLKTADFIEKTTIPEIQNILHEFEFQHVTIHALQQTYVDFFKMLIQKEQFTMQNLRNPKIEK